MKKVYIRYPAIILLLPFAVLIFLPKLLNAHKEYVRTNLVERGTIQDGVSPFWKASGQAIESAVSIPERKYAYYKVKDWQNSNDIIEHFSVDPTTFESLNPQAILPGATIKIPPPTRPLSHLPPTNLALNSFKLIIDANKIEISTSQKNLQVIDLAQLSLKINDPTLLQQIAPNHWLLKKNLVFGKNIRLQLETPSIQKLDLLSSHSTIVCICNDGGELLINGLAIQTWDPAINDVDTNFADKRSFIRSRKSSRTDIINSDISYLGYEEPSASLGGGTLGLSWRVNPEQINVDVATGWIENNRIHNNYTGLFGLGTSGLVVRKNEFMDNDKSGIQLRDYANNLLVEDNIFRANQSHGAIVYNQSNFNIFRHNTFLDNTGNGIIFYHNSGRNLIEENTLSGNRDNIVAYSSSFNVFQTNTFDKPRKNNIRLNKLSQTNIVRRNTFKTGVAIKIYDQSRTNLIAQNTIYSTSRTISIDKSSADTVIYNNAMPSKARIVLAAPHVVIMGPNTYKDPITTAENK